MQDSFCRSSWNLNQLKLTLKLYLKLTVYAPFQPAILPFNISCAFFQTSLQSLIFAMCLLSHILLNLINPIPEQCFSLFHPLLRTSSDFFFFFLCRDLVTLLFSCFSDSIYSTIPDSFCLTLLIPLGCTCRCHKQAKSA